MAALDGGAASAAEVIATFARGLGAPVSLREIGLAEDDLERAIDLVDVTLSQLPEPVSRSDTAALLGAAFAGATLTREVTVR